MWSQYQSGYGNYILNEALKTRNDGHPDRYAAFAGLVLPSGPPRPLSCDVP